MSFLDQYDLRDLVYKAAIVFGALIVFYGILWLLATLGMIPAVVAAVFPNIVIIALGLFIIYAAVKRRDNYY